MERKRGEKHVGIITTNVRTSLNYGGVLQAYALQHTLDKLGFASEIIQYNSSGKKVATFLKSELGDRSSTWLMVKRIIRFGSSFVSARLKRGYIAIAKKVYLEKRMQQRGGAFQDFKGRHISLSQIQYSRNSIHETADIYDIFVCGSDMIWKPGKYDPTYFLDFVPDDVLKIAYAPSIGVSHLSESEAAYMKPLVNRLDAISVREKQGKELLEKITDKNVEWVLDPTMLLTTSEWDEVSQPYEIGSPYLFCYLLGSNRKNFAYAENLAKRLGLLLVTLPFVAGDHLAGITFGDRKLYDVGPGEFISLIRNAEFIVTDSFHGTVFSILYNKKFFVLPRTADDEFSSNSRIDSLLEKFNLTILRVQLLIDKCPNLNADPENYSIINNEMLLCRDYAMRYLKHNFH